MDDFPTSSLTWSFALQQDMPFSFSAELEDETVTGSTDSQTACGGIDISSEDFPAEVSSTTHISSSPDRSQHKPNPFKALDHNPKICQVCSEAAAGFHCGAFVCEACKKFYIRMKKQSLKTLSCIRFGGESLCVITKETRNICQACRYHKCIDIGMHPPGSGLLDKTKVSRLPCVICAGLSSGFHFGVLTCECCKSFFRRCLKDRKQPSLLCLKKGLCDPNKMSKSSCRNCRFQKCIKAGMNAKSVKLGRQSNIIRYSRILEYHETQHTEGALEAAIDFPTQEDEECKPIWEPDMNANMIKEFQQLKLKVVNYEDPVLSDTEASPAEFFAAMVKSYTNNIRAICAFFQTLPKFQMLNPDDQLFLAKFSNYPVVLLLISQTYDLKSNRFSVFSIRSWQGGVKHLLKFFPTYHIIVRHFKEIGKRIKLLDLDEMEEALLLLLLVVAPVSVAELNDVGGVRESQLSNMNLLTDYVHSKHGLNNNRLGSLLMLLTDLRAAAHQHHMVAKSLTESLPLATAV